MKMRKMMVILEAVVVKLSLLVVAGNDEMVEVE